MVQLLDPAMRSMAERLAFRRHHCKIPEHGDPLYSADTGGDFTQYAST